MRPREFISRVRALFGRHQMDAELSDEIRAHLDLLADEHARRGMSPADARAAARREFGGVEQVKEQHREQREFRWLGDLARDLRHAVRLLASHPGFALIAVLSMAVGIGVNCAIYSFAEATLLRPLTVPRADEVLTVGSQAGFSSSESLLASYREFVDIRDQDRSFERLVAFADVTVGFALDARTTPKFALAMLVSGDLLGVMDVRPQLGRDFLPEEDQVPGRNPVVILGRTFWAEQLAADPTIVGRTVRLNGIDFTVIGVAPEGFTGLAQYSRFDFFAPLMMWPRLIADPRISPLDARDFRRVAIRRNIKSRRHDERGAGRAHRDRREPRTRVSGERAGSTSRRTDRAAEPDCERAAPAHAADHVGAALRRGAAGRVRRRGRPPGEPRPGACPRNRPAHGARRGTVACGATARHRKSF